jgi:drug/metabolite transporter (DMT)-like permease
MAHIQGVHSAGRDVVRGPVAFMLNQAMIMQPTLAPLWILGVAWMLLGSQRSRLAVFAWAFVFVIGVFIATHGKNYYPTPVYPVALAAGAVALEGFCEQRPWRVFRWVYAGLVVIAGAVLAPLAAPILSPEGFLPQASGI